MRPPIRFIYRNLVFGETLDDAWAIFRLGTQSYAGLTPAGKRELLAAISSLTDAVEADFALLRVARGWSVDRYSIGVEARADVRHMHRKQIRAHVDGQREHLMRRGSYTPEVFLSVRLPRERSSLFARLPLVSSVTRQFAPAELSTRRLEDLQHGQDRVLDRVVGFLDCKPAATYDLQWLVRRAFCRSLGEPVTDQRFVPQALVVEPLEDGATGARVRPLEVDVMRLFDSPISIERRWLRVECEPGDSYQTFLCLGALPEAVHFPSRRAELLFAPLESVDFPVDAAFCARFVSSAKAARLVRRRVVDADSIHADHGHSRLLRAGISLCVSADSHEQLEDRVERLRREYRPLKLHRPLGDQLRLFVTHLPGQRSRVSCYDDYFTAEQLGAMVPLATHAVGAELGPCIGHRLGGSRQPVLFDSAEAWRTGRARATLLSGAPGSGKSLCMELIMYQAFLAGSMICDIDPRGDHALAHLPGMSGHVEVIELSPAARFAGMLDPLLAGPDESREDLACSFMLSVLPEDPPAAWKLEIRRAVRTVAARRAGGCGTVVEELSHGSHDAQDAARALATYGSSGLARLGFATTHSPASKISPRQVTTIRIRDLAGERLSQAVLHLLVVYAMRLATADSGRHSVIGFDDAGMLLADRALLECISTFGRARNVTPLLATRRLGEVNELKELVGAAFCFGVETEREAGEALRLLGLDEENAALQQGLLSYRRGRCLMRDHAGRVSAVQIDPVDQQLLAALDTSAPRARAHGTSRLSQRTEGS